jgi:RND family efflux transporter MFP subunit
MRDQPDILRHSTPPRLKFWGVAALCVAGAVAAAGIGLRLYNGHQAADWARDQDLRTVQLVKLSSVQGGALILPGDVQPWINATIYAEVSGYVRNWLVDIGTPVKAGQLLAQIDPRPYQAALDQVKGQLAKDQATLAGAQADLQRYQGLLAVNAIARQTADDEAATVGTDKGIVEADKANVETAQINLNYTRIVAPFDGVVTSRSLDVGQLVLVGTPGATPLFTVTDETKLRIYVRVPQTDAGAVTDGMMATFTVPELPGHNFTAKLAASAGAVVSSSGTQLLQFQADNHDRLIKPGDYAEMHFSIPSTPGAVHVPATALMFRDQGMMVATVDGGNRIRLKVVTIHRDLGASVEISSGLSSSDRVIDNPPDAIREGDLVKVKAEDNS